MRSERTCPIAPIACEDCGGVGYSVEVEAEWGWNGAGPFPRDRKEECWECEGIGFARCCICGKRDDTVAVASVEGPMCLACVEEIEQELLEG